MVRTIEKRRLEREKCIRLKQPPKSAVAEHALLTGHNKNYGSDQKLVELCYIGSG